MKEISIIGIVGVYLYGCFAILGAVNLLTLRYVIFDDDQSLQVAKRSLIIINIFIASILKLLFYIGMIRNEFIDIGFYVMYALAACLLLLTVLLFSGQLVTIGGLVDVYSSSYICSFSIFILLITSTTIGMIVTYYGGIPSTPIELKDGKFKAILYIEAANELFRTIITILSLNVSSLYLHIHIDAMIAENRARTPVLTIDEDDEAKLDKNDIDERQISDYSNAFGDDDDDEEDDSDLIGVIKRLKIFFCYIFFTQISGLVVNCLKLSDVSSASYYTITAFIFSDFIPDGGFILAMLYLTKGKRSYNPYMLVRVSELRERLHRRCLHTRGRKKSKSPPVT